MTDLYRVFPYDPAAKSTEPGAALFVPAPYNGRIANPHLYHEWYFARDAAGAVAEYFARFARWQPATFSPQAKLPFATARYALSSDRICDLNDTEILVRFGIVRPTDVTSANRRLTQAWARAIFDTGQYDGITWWSHFYPMYQIYGIWNHEVIALADPPSLLTIDHEAVRQAARDIVRQLSNDR